jgi:hypothetical protein
MSWIEQPLKPKVCSVSTALQASFSRRLGLAMKASRGIFFVTKDEKSFL